MGVGITSPYFLGLRAFVTINHAFAPFVLLLQDWPSPEDGEAEVGAVWEQKLLWGGEVAARRLQVRVRAALRAGPG